MWWYYSRTEAFYIHGSFLPNNVKTGAADVVVIGGGIAGVSTAYFLGQAGLRCVVIERDYIGSHASGFAYGGVGALGGAGPLIEAKVPPTPQQLRACVFINCSHSVFLNKLV